MLKISVIIKYSRLQGCMRKPSNDQSCNFDKTRKFFQQKDFEN